MADQPIEPTVVELSGERADGATPPPQPPGPPSSTAPANPEDFDAALARTTVTVVTSDEVLRAAIEEGD
ncbi:hypothetical protein ACWC5I_40765, partial [Kitasatospora sp. NPDC001574]